MVLAAVDDLMFASRITNAARQLGIEVAFARTANDLVAVARARRPALIIFDLNSRGLHPLETATRLQDDPDLARIPSVGFVSHVQSDLIAAARDAGVGEVLARSAFTAKLAEILERGRSSGGA